MSVANSGSVGNGKPFEIIVGDAGGEILNGDVPVRWCITPDTVKDMEDAGIVDPHILLISYRKNTNIEMDRKLIPITEIMTYVRFTRAGEHTLASWIVDGYEGRNYLKNTFLKEKEDLTIWKDGKESPRITLKKISYTHCHINVKIPDEAFGKEPPKWLKWFGNVWHSKGPVDQCAFRKRCILAFTLKWMPMLAWIFISILLKVVGAAVMVGLGYMRAPNYSHTFRPFDRSMSWFIDDIDWNVFDHPFTFKKDWNPEGGHYSGLQTFISPLMFVPVVVLFFVFIGLVVGNAAWAGTFITIWLFFFGCLVAWDVVNAGLSYLSYSNAGDALYKHFHRLDMHLAETGNWPYVIMGIIATVIASLVYLLFTSWAFQLFVGSVVTIVATSYGMLKLHDHMTKNDLDKNDYTQIRELLCPRDPLNIEAKYELIPPKQRTVHLWVAKVKNKICKPMQY